MLLEGPTDAWMRDAQKLKHQLGKAEDDGSFAVTKLKKSSKEVAAVACLKSVTKIHNSVGKAKNKLSSKMTQAVTANEATFKGTKHAWRTALEEAEQAYLLHVYIL